jgi:isoleucyl-tRNA synthetase
VAYPDVQSQPKFPAIEEAVSAFWAADQTFEASVQLRSAGEKGNNEFVFYDGPPFANGLPHYGHLLTGFVKDAVPRYQTMRGRRVERRFGWDCHGLPAEVEAEKEIGIAGHPEIAAFGIDKFNDVCRTSVLRYTSEWERYVTRQARWVDFSNDYKTLDTPYMESVMWAFHTLWEKGLIYEGFRVLPYCWRCETPLSNTETRMDDVYQDRQDPALSVWFLLESGERIMAWTTTPWTLPSNLALAVGADIDYAVMQDTEGVKYILAESRLGSYEKEFSNAEQVASIKGSELAGRKYTPLFPFLADTENAFQVLTADFVSTEDGTGVVHLAPGFGEDDQLVCASAGIATICPMDDQGCYTELISTWVGTHVFEANPLVIRQLKDEGRVIRHDTYNHSYPHCWRCAQPLVYRAVSSWFVEVTKFRDRMVELNENIHWVPEHLKHGSFGKWIANARDWSISRNRFWGSPIPVWKSDNPLFPRVDVYGSVAQLQADFGVEVSDLHRPFIDNLTRPNPDDPSGESVMRRVPEVLDCWFESGSMPFAQVHYPFENQEWFENHYPGDFIVEYVAQSRGWFYTLHVLATALFDRPAFSTCVGHGVVLGDDGAKMSKSLRNYPDPMEVFNTYGADAMRWYLLSSPILRGGDFSVTEAGIRETVRQVLLPMWNSWYFLTLYANAEGKQGKWSTDSTNVLDKYILSKTHDLVVALTQQFDEYDLFEACATIRTYLDVLTNWYIRRSRDRFWSGDQDAINTLHTALTVLCRVAAPLLPMVSEEIYRGLTGERSVHLTDWPSQTELVAHPELTAAMDKVRDVCSTALSIRKANGRRVRLPLTTLTIATPELSGLDAFIDIVKDEVNVRNIEFRTDVGEVAKHELQVTPKALGPRLGGDTQKVIAAVKSGNWAIVDGAPVAGGFRLEEGEYSLKLVAAQGAASAALSHHPGVVVLDVDLTPELEAEGAARDLIRALQQTRRSLGFVVTDRISVAIAGPVDFVNAVSSHVDMMAREVLATHFTLEKGSGEPQHVESLEGHEVQIWMALAGK